MTQNEEVQAWLDVDPVDLIDTIVADVERHVRQLRSSGQPFYGYAVLPSDYCTQPDPTSLVVAFNRESDLSPESSNDPYFRYSVGDWQNYVSDEFASTNAALSVQLAEFKERHTRAGDPYELDEYELAFVRRINQAMLAALLKMKRRGAFADDTYLIVWLPDSGDGIMGESAKALNSARIYSEYASEFEE